MSFSEDVNVELSQREHAAGHWRPHELCLLFSEL